MAQLSKIGIRGTLKSYESAAGYSVFGKGDFTLIAAQDRSMDTPDPESLFSVIYSTNAGSNYGRWSDPKVDELAELEGWFFRDKKVMGYKPALTTYDNNTFMKVWLRE